MITIGSKIELSVIVPVYNVENHLKNCINSLLESCGDGCEIILVDDGSTDSSAEICGAFRSRYGNISVIRKQNGGLASARNAGINAAKGEYITFVDSDDAVGLVVEHGCHELACFANAHAYAVVPAIGAVFTGEIR